MKRTIVIGRMDELKVWGDGVIDFDAWDGAAERERRRENQRVQAEIRATLRRPFN